MDLIIIEDKLDCHELLGVTIMPITLRNTIKIINNWISNHSPNYICHAPAHAIMSCYDQPALLEIYNNSGLTVPDGMAIVWLLKFAGFKNVDRVYGPDLLLEMCKEGLSKGYKHYFYGGSKEVIEALIKKLEAMFPGIKIAGYESPPFRELTSVENDDVKKRILNSKADLLWVGLGSPKQEIWMYENINRINKPVMIGVGAAFDFISGAKPQAPTWVQKIGMEWFFRWLSEPGRLFRRYIINYPRFVILVTIDQLLRRNRTKEGLPKD